MHLDDGIQVGKKEVVDIIKEEGPVRGLHLYPPNTVRPSCKPESRVWFYVIVARFVSFKQSCRVYIIVEIYSQIDISQSWNVEQKHNYPRKVHCIAFLAISGNSKNCTFFV